MNYWPPVKPRPPIIQRDFFGVNRLDPFSLRDGFFSETVNLSNLKFPALTTRPGFSVLGTFGRVLGMGVWKELELHVVTGDGKWRRLNADGSWTELASGLDTSAPWSFTNAKLNLPDVCLIGTNGITPKYYNGTSVQTLNGVPAGGKYITHFSDRLWCAKDNVIYYSAYRKADDWTQNLGDDTDAGDVTTETDDGESINSIQAGFTKLTITKPSSVLLLFGYSPADYEMRKVTLVTGQFNYKSGFTLDGWLYQLYDTGFFKYAGSGAPDNSFSERIKYYFNGLNQSAKSDAALGYDGNRLYLSLGSSLIEYDPKRDTYYPWTGIPALHFAQVQDRFYIGDSSGRIIRLGVSSNDAGQPIAWKAVSKPFTAPSMAQGMRWLRMWLTLDLPSGSTFNVYLSPSPSGEDWVRAGETIAGNGSIQRRPIYFPSNIVPPTKNIRIKFEGTGPMTLYEFAREEDYMPLR